MPEKDLEKLCIRRVTDAAELPLCAKVIRASFTTVAETFGLTRENCPGHTAFLTDTQLQRRFAAGEQMHLCLFSDQPAGFFALCPKGNGRTELENLSVLPQYRRQGVGSAMLDLAATTAKSTLGAQQLTIGIMDENVPLRRWYEKHGFVCTGRRRFAHLPFTVSFWQKTLA